MNPSDPDKAADFLEAAFFGGEELLDQATVDLSVELPLIEGYKLLRLLGEGGFGMVYEAEQRVPIRRRVALKVLRPGHTTRELLARFEQERQVLALLNHPHIAKVFDAGETEDGRPFIAMELVTGRTIDRHAQDLDLRGKVELMRDVCRAVGHAHHKGIIHRDLKPSNILITRPENGPPEPRVIDFGIAKAMDGPLSSKVMFTQIRQVVGTPGYLSPERQHTSQIRHGADTRADVFALGAILWELVAGETPRQSSEGGETRVTLPNGKASPDELRWIVSKATDGDMERRYANADGLADDLERWLEGRPLVAAPQSSLYVLMKWTQRNRALSMVALVSGVALFVAGVAIVQSYRRAREALAEAERTRAGMQETLSHADYLMGMTRARRRPVHAMAQWARALRSDPSNRAAMGMLLSTWGQRTYPHPVAPAVGLPEGKVGGVAVSMNGRWAAVVTKCDGGVQSVARCRRGDDRPMLVEIPADGEIVNVAVSNEGIVAVAGLSGPAGLLQHDGTWKASEREVEGCRGLLWSESGDLWMLGLRQLAWCDSSGAETHPAVSFPATLERWVVFPSGRGILAAVGGGRLMVFREAGAEPKTITAPIPAPVTAVAVSSDGTRVAASWRNGDVWVRRDEGDEHVFKEYQAIDLRFSRSGDILAAYGPRQVRWLDVNQWVAKGETSLDRALRSMLETDSGLWVLVPVFGPPSVYGEGDPMEMPGFGTQVRLAVSGSGGIIALADAEHGALEWLGFANRADALSERDIAAAWHSLVPSAFAGTWTGVDAEGWVCEVSEAGGSIRGWRCSERAIRLASVDSAGKTVLIDSPGPPNVRVVHEGGDVVEIESNKPSAMALSGDGQFVVLGSPNSEVRILDAKSGSELFRKDWQRGPVTAVAFVNPERVALAFSTQLRVWDWRDDTSPPSILDYSRPLTALAADPSGTRLAATGQGDLHVIDIASGLRVVGALKTAIDATSLAWETDGDRIWAFSHDGAPHGIAMPPAVEVSPPWLPDFIERHTGMRVNDQGRVVRVQSGHPLPSVPSDADPALKAWLSRQVR